MNFRIWRRFLAITVFGVFMLSSIPAGAQVATGDVAGTIKDAQGGVIPGATVTLVSQSQATSRDTTTNADGAFIFTNVAGDSYLIRVTMDGFKTLERPNVPVSAGDRVSVGTLTIESACCPRRSLVSGEAPMIQAHSGERSFVATTEAVQNLPVANRNFANLGLLRRAWARTRAAPLCGWDLRSEQLPD